MANDTRERIITTARQIFNDRRFGDVTLAELADEIGIAKGNVWYHFKDKRALLNAITDQYLERIDAREKLWPVKSAVLESYSAFLKAVLEEIRDFRFMYRDQADYGEHSKRLLKRLPAIYAHVIKQLVAFYAQLRAEGHLDIEDSRIEALAINVVLVLRYYLEFSRESGLASAAGSGAAARAFAQHLTLFDDRLTPMAARYLRTALSTPADAGVGSKRKQSA
jgi:AcrR family transcriptional regulator